MDIFNISSKLFFLYNSFCYDVLFVMFSTVIITYCTVKAPRYLLGVSRLINHRVSVTSFGCIVEFLSKQPVISWLYKNCAKDDTFISSKVTKLKQHYVEIDLLLLFINNIIVAK